MNIEDVSFFDIEVTEAERKKFKKELYKLIQKQKEG